MGLRARLFLPLVVALGCGGDKAPKSETLIVPDACDGRDAGIVCEKGVAFTCAAGDVQSKEDCSAQELKCDTGYGCGVCRPRTYECEGNSLLLCSEDGRSRELQHACPEGTLCSASGCADLCAEAERDRSYIGCDYWPVFTLNSQLHRAFRPAVVVGNPQLVPIQVKLTLGAETIAEAEVPPNATHTIEIPELPAEPLRVTASHSVLARQAAYHLVSNAPITVHQFNPLHYKTEARCGGDGPDKDEICTVHSHTNDASLLLPSHILRREDGEYVSYLGVSRATFIAEDKDRRNAWPGFLALVAVGNEPVEVTIEASAYTRPALEADAEGRWVGAAPGDAGVPDAGEESDGGMDASAPDAGVPDAGLDAGDAEVLDDGAASSEGLSPSPAVFSPEPHFVFPALRPGETKTLTLQPGDVLQLVSGLPADCPGEERPTAKAGEKACDPGKLYDLTGTSIRANGPVQVIGGHDCSFVPFYRYACDHLEETIFPLETWGRSVIVGAPDAQSGTRLYRLRVVSAADDNRISFEPAVHDSVTLGRGEWLEFETDENVLVQGTRALSVAQYLIGQGSSGPSDPSLTLVPPTEQYRNRYNFLSPDTYVSNFVMVIAPEYADVVLDGDTLRGFSPIGDTGYKIVTKKLTRAGDHELHSVSGAPVGITLYGVGQFTSYMLPGGLDLRVIPDIY